MTYKFRSKFEESIYKTAVKSNLKLDFENQKLPYTHTFNYIPDFELPNGILVEAKGYFRPADRVKMVAVKKCNPDKDIRLVFQVASKPIRKGSKMTYGDWADKYGFQWAEGTIPAAWWKERING